jgi:hypothetical protein
MRTLLLIATILFSITVAKAQGFFFPSKVGTVLEYKSYDKKEKETGTIRYTITDLKSEGDNMDITYLIESIDAKEKLQFKEELTIHKKGDKLYLDMSSFLRKVAFQKAGDKADKIEITGNDMEIPSNIKPGDILPDSNVDIAMKMGFINIKMSANVTERKVEALEKVVVKAGNFDAYKITSIVSSNAMGMKTNSPTTEWLVKGIGMVKSVTYDKKGNVNSYTELISKKE